MFSEPYIYISFVLSMIILLHPFKGIWNEKTPATFMQLLSMPFGISDFPPFAAIFCVIPFAGSFCEDYNSGYINFTILRTGVSKYAFQRCTTVLLSGGILMSSVVSATIAVCAVLANAPDTEETIAFMRHTIWAREGVILMCHGLIFSILKILLAFLFGAVWAGVGLVISVLSANSYVTYICPFVIYQILWFALEGSAFNPEYYLRGDADFIPSFGFAVIYQSILIAICFLVSFKGIRERVKYNGNCGKKGIFAN